MKLFYFTNSYPYGFGEAWKTRELDFLKNHFSSITVIPLSYEGNKTPVAKIPGITYADPLYETVDVRFRKRNLFRSLLDVKQITILVSEFFSNRKKIHATRSHKKLLDSFCFAIRIIQNKAFQQHMANVDSDTVLYFFWGRGLSEAIPFIRRTIKVKKCICRMHGYDLYEERNNGYIPFQLQQIRYFDLVLPCSETGRKELHSRYSRFARKIVTQRLGVNDFGNNPSNPSGILSIVSCSNVIPLKRVHLICEALQFLDTPVSWVHFGCGELLEDLRRRASQSRSNVSITLKGKVANSDVFNFYQHTPVDLFLNVSETEGVPVSIMEALSFGIPVIATDVGGTSEIVNASLGCLLPKNFRPSELAQLLIQFHAADDDVKQNFRRNSKEQFYKTCNNETLNADLLKLMKK